MAREDYLIRSLKSLRACRSYDRNIPAVYRARHIERKSVTHERRKPIFMFLALVFQRNTLKSFGKR